MSNINHIGSPKTLAVPPVHRDIKTYQQVKADEAGGGSSLTPAEWLERASAYVEGVQNGTIQEDPNDPNYAPIWQYEQWIQQVSSQIFSGGAGGGGNWDPTAGGTPAAAQPQCPPGAIVGADGNFVFDGKSADVVYDGNPTRSDVNSEKVRMAVDSMGANYTFSMVPDGVTGEEVLKVVVDGPKGQQTYIFNNVNDPDFHLNLFAANKDKVNLDGLPADIQGKIVVGDIENLSTELANPQASVNGDPIDGKAVEGEDNAFKYEAATVTDIIDFYPVAGENETHYVTGNTTINIPLSSTAAVAPIMDGSKPGYNYVVVVTHEDHSTDTYYLKGDTFNHHINGLPENISFITGANPDGSPIVQTGKVPSGYQNDFTIYGAEGGAAVAGDSTPDKTGDLNGVPVNTFNTAADVTLHAGGATTGTWNDIFATGNVNLSTQTNQDNVFVDRLPDGTVQINITRANDGITESFFVHPGTSGLPAINITGNNITYGPGFGGPALDGTPTVLSEADGLAAVYTLGKISVNGANQAEAMVAAAGGAQGAIPPNMQAFMDSLGLSGETGNQQLITAVNQAFGVNYTSIGEVADLFNNAKDNNQISEGFIRMVYLLDPGFQAAYDEAQTYAGDDDSEGTHDDWLAANETAVTRLAELTRLACPNSPAASIRQRSDGGGVLLVGTTQYFLTSAIAEGNWPASA